MFVFISLAGMNFGLQGQHNWDLTPAKYAFSAEVTAVVTLDTDEVDQGTLGAFVGDECRGFVDAAEFPPTGRFVFTLLFYSNDASGEEINFRYYDAANGITYEIQESIIFAADAINSNANDPFGMTAVTNLPPALLNPIPDVFLTEFFDSTDIDLSEVFTDPDNDTLLFFSESDDISVVKVSVFDSILRIYEADPGLASIVVLASDGINVARDTFIVSVSNINETPIVENAIDDLFLDEYFGSRQLSIDTLFFDPDGDNLTYTLTNSADSVVEVTLVNTTLTINETGLGSSVVTITATDDGEGNLSESTSFTVEVSNINDDPEIIDPIDDQIFQEGFETFTINLLNHFFDKDLDTLTYLVNSSNSSVVTVSVMDSILTITEHGLGNAVINITASDGDLSVSDQFNVNVNNTNDPPQVVSPLPDRTIDEGFGEILISLAQVFSDPDGDVLELTASNRYPDVSNVSVSGTTLKVTEIRFGVDTIVVYASDNELSSTDTFALTINKINDVPVVQNALADTIVDEYFGSVTIDISEVFTDADGDELTLEAVSNDLAVAEVLLLDNFLTVTEVGLGSALITVTATDGEASANDSFMITVNNVNDPPIVRNPIQDIYLEEYFDVYRYNFSKVFFDKDGDALSYSIISNNEEVVTVAIVDDSIQFNEVGLGTSLVTLTASDGVSAAVAEFDVIVNNVNDPPVLQSLIQDQDTLEYFGSYTIDLDEIFIDPENDPVFYQVESSDPEVVTVSVSGSIMEILEAGLGVSTISITATDNDLSTLYQFTIRVENVNDPPVVVNSLPDTSIIQNLEVVEYPLENVFNDKDNDTLSFYVVSERNFVEAVIVDSVLSFYGVRPGTTTLVIFAEDKEYTTSDTIIIEVIKENPLIVEYDAMQLSEIDTIYRSNDAGGFLLDVQTLNEWSSEYESLGWNVVEHLDDSTLSIGYSENLTSKDRAFNLTIEDAQGHVVHLVIIQTLNVSDESQGLHDADFLIYPNPVDHVLFIEAGDRSGGALIFDLIDSNGRLMAQKKIERFSGETITFNMSDYKQGVYFIRISGRSGTVSRTLIKR
jgi:hypothetical protein